MKGTGGMDNLNRRRPSSSSAPPLRGSRGHSRDRGGGYSDRDRDRDRR